MVEWMIFNMATREEKRKYKRDHMYKLRHGYTRSWYEEKRLQKLVEENRCLKCEILLAEAPFHNCDNPLPPAEDEAYGHSQE